MKKKSFGQDDIHIVISTFDEEGNNPIYISDDIPFDVTTIKRIVNWNTIYSKELTKQLIGPIPSKTFSTIESIVYKFPIRDPEIKDKRLTHLTQQNTDAFVSILFHIDNDSSISNIRDGLHQKLLEWSASKKEKNDITKNDISFFLSYINKELLSNKALQKLLKDETSSVTDKIFLLRHVENLIRSTTQKKFNITILADDTLFLDLVKNFFIFSGWHNDFSLKHKSNGFTIKIDKLLINCDLIQQNRELKKIKTDLIIYFMNVNCEKAHSEIKINRVNYLLDIEEPFLLFYYKRYKDEIENPIDIPIVDIVKSSKKIKTRGIHSVNTDEGSLVSIIARFIAQVEDSMR